MLRIAGLFLLLAACGSRSTGTVTTSVEDLWRGFDADAAAMDKKLAGKTLIVDGTLESIAGPGSARPTLFLRTPGHSATAFLATGPATPRLRGAIGRRVQIRCARVDHVGAAPALYDCTGPA